MWCFNGSLWIHATSREEIKIQKIAQHCFGWFLFVSLVSKLVQLTFTLLRTSVNVTVKLQSMVLCKGKKRAPRFSGFLYHFYCCFLTLSLKYSLCYLNGTSADWLSSLYLIVWKVLVKSVRPWRPSNLLSAIEPERHYVLGLTCLFYLQLYVIDKKNLTHKRLGWM